MMLLQKKGNNLTGGKCWFRPYVFSARKDVSLTSWTDAIWGNRRWKAHFLCGLIRFLPATSAIDKVLCNPIISDTVKKKKKNKPENKLNGNLKKKNKILVSNLCHWYLQKVKINIHYSLFIPLSFLWKYWWSNQSEVSNFKSWANATARFGWFVNSEQFMLLLWCDALQVNKRNKWETFKSTLPLHHTPTHADTHT